jgi:hypothetical protein
MKQPTKQLAAVVFLWQYNALKRIAEERGCSVSDVLRDRLSTLPKAPANPRKVTP